MTKEELLTYYRNNKNLNNEITLRGKVTGFEYKFRHYIEYSTDKDYWVNLKNGLLFDTKCVIEKYDFPKNYDKDKDDKFFKSLKVGDVIALVYWDDIEVYFKKVDDDCFIGCDKAGHISSDPLDKTFIYKSKLFKSATTKELKKVIE